MLLTCKGASPQIQNLFVKSGVFILPCLSFSVFKALSIWCNTPLEVFFSTAPNSFWTRRFWCLLVRLPFFVSSLPRWQNVYLGGHFSPRRTTNKKVTRGEIRCIGTVGHGVVLILVKHCSTPGAVWAGALINHPSWNGQTQWKSLQKIFTEAKWSPSHHHQLVHWHRWIPRTLT